MNIAPRHRRETASPGDAPDADGPVGEAAAPRRRSWSIRTRLAALLALPTAALVIVAAIGVSAQASEVGRVDETVQSVQLILRTQDVIHELQRERGLSTGLVAGDAGFRGQLDAQRSRVDQVRATWEQQLRSSAAGQAVAASSGRLADLTSTRQRVDARTIDPPSTVGFFTALIADLSGAANRQQVGYADAEIERGLSALRTISDAKEATGQERAIGNGIFVANSFEGRSYLQFTAVHARRLAGLDDFRVVASPGEAQSLQAALSSKAGVTTADLEQRGLDGPTSPALGVNAAQWYGTLTDFIDGLRTTQQVVGADIQSRADAVQSQARDLLVLFAVLALLAVAGIVVLVLAAARAIVRPVTRLAEHADDIALRWLPRAVAEVQASRAGGAAQLPTPPNPLAGTDRGASEIVELGDALENVRDTALRLAAEQSLLRHNTATSLGALGRRNQNLVSRQIGLIDDLERDEADPEVLGNLFTLDHLATRMRRNAESVLVLVGERSTRRWSTSVGVDDVVRAAISEVEDYPRVQLKPLERGAFTGAAAADITHITAELLENALAFSPPDRPVELHGQRIDGGYLIAIVDHGTGMDEPSLATANARLQATQSFVVAPTRFLGHYVVGALARRLGVDVHLQRSPLTGLTARITVPDALLATPGAPDGPAFVVEPDESVATRTPTQRGATNGIHHDRGDLADSGALVTVRERTRPGRPTRAPAPAAPGPTGEQNGADDAGGGPEPTATTPAAVVNGPMPATAAARTTRNGLVKRVRGGSAAEGTSKPTPGPRPSPRPETDAERTPEEVRSMLANFRQGYRRPEPGNGSVSDAATTAGSASTTSSVPGATGNGSGARSATVTGPSARAVDPAEARDTETHRGWFRSDDPAGAHPTGDAEARSHEVEEER